MALVYLLYIHRITSTQLGLEGRLLMSYAFLSHRANVLGARGHHALVAPTQNMT